MKKKIFLMLFASMFVNNMFADITETMPDTGADEIVAGDEEVPL